VPAWQADLALRVLNGLKVNWIIWNDRRYLISSMPLHGEYRLTVPGERISIILDKLQMKRAVMESLGLSGKPQVKAINRS
jgi:hypothetical protein